MEQIQVTLLNLLRTLFPANIWNWSYFTGLWGRYANLGGFITGAIVLVILYYSTDGDGRKRGIFHVFAVIALINAIDGVYMLMMNFVNAAIFHRPTTVIESSIHGAFNPLSLMILVLVISECYRDKTRKAFFFGLSTFGVSVLMFGSGYTQETVLIYFFIRVLLAAILCAILTKVAYTFISYIVMGVFFIISEGTQALIMQMYTCSGQIDIKESLYEILSAYKAEYVIIFIITVVFAIFEIFILTEGKFNFKALSLGKATLGSLLVVASSVAVIYIGLYYYQASESSIDVVTDESIDQNISYENVEVSHAEASSSLTSQKSGDTYGIEYTIDGSNDTCWQDGQDGDGVGETLTYWFDSNVILGKILIKNGRILSEEKYFKNNRLASAVIHYYLNDELVGEQEISLEDIFTDQTQEFITDEQIECNQVVIEVTGVYKGSKYKDLCVTEVAFQKIVNE